MRNDVFDLPATARGEWRCTAKATARGTAKAHGTTATASTAATTSSSSRGSASSKAGEVGALRYDLDRVSKR
jgi:hypothetical protein